MISQLHSDQGNFFFMLDETIPAPPWLLVVMNGEVVEAARCAAGSPSPCGALVQLPVSFGPRKLILKVCM
jgi:hypothetical protein